MDTHAGVETDTLCGGVMTTATPRKEFPGDQSFGLGEVPPTFTGGGHTSGWMRGRVETGCLSAVHVLATGENEMGTLDIFVEPQLPMTHLKKLTIGRRR